MAALLFTIPINFILRDSLVPTPERRVRNKPKHLILSWECPARTIMMTMITFHFLILYLLLLYLLLFRAKLIMRSGP